MKSNQHCIGEQCLLCQEQEVNKLSWTAMYRLKLLAPEFVLSFSATCIQTVNNTGIKYVTIMKQTAF